MIALKSFINIEPKGTAYVRITPEFRDFLKKVNEQYEVLGFDYDFDEADLNFGVIVGEEKK